MKVENSFNKLKLIKGQLQKKKKKKMNQLNDN